MELQDQVKSDWSRYFCNQPPVDFDTSANHHLFWSELESNSMRLEGHSDPCSSIWTDFESDRFKNCNSRSFALEARIRLDNLKSGCNSPEPCCVVDRTLYKYNFQKDLWDSEPEEEEESALDLVELLDVEDDVQDEESWLYESPKKQVTVEKTESALTWCRHVLDNPSPEMEAACRLLINRLDQRSSSHLYRRPAVYHHTDNTAVGSSLDKSSVNTTQKTSDSLDNDELSISHDSINTNYKLEDITDVHIMARIQEASLRQDYVSTPAAASPRRNPESPVLLPSYFSTTVEDVNDFTPGNKTEVSSSSGWQPRVLSLSSSSCQSPTSAPKQSCQSPKLARLHQQVAQFKLLKRAQNQATSPGRTRSPLQTSLRSLQAIRNSRSLETDDCHPADQIVHPPSGASSGRMGSNCWSPSSSAASMNSNVLSHSVGDSLVRVTAMKRLHRSQSLSPCRIPHPARGHLSAHGRVFASPDGSTAVGLAWARNAPNTGR